MNKIKNYFSISHTDIKWYDRFMFYVIIVLLIATAYMVSPWS